MAYDPVKVRRNGSLKYHDYSLHAQLAHGESVFSDAIIERLRIAAGLPPSAAVQAIFAVLGIGKGKDGGGTGNEAPKG